MTVQELINELNKRIKDKSKDIWAYDESRIYIWQLSMMIMLCYFNHKL